MMYDNMVCPECGSLMTCETKIGIRFCINNGELSILSTPLSITENVRMNIEHNRPVHVECYECGYEYALEEEEH